MNYSELGNLRPANMRRTHGLRSDRLTDLSVSSVRVVEDVLCDPWNVRESGGGMDAPPDIPTGSIKAFFTDTNGNKQYTVAFGFCQRTAVRNGERP